MKRQTNIELNRFTNFLRQGAFVRRQGVWTLLFDSSQAPAFEGASTLNTDFLSSVVSRKHYKNQWDISNGEFLELLELASKAEYPNTQEIIAHWLPIDKSKFAKAYEIGHRAITKGEIQKFVPIACQEGRLSQKISLWQKLSLLKALTEAPPELFPYGEWDQESGFTGASPEIFFELDQLNIRTMALAGTSGKEVDPSLFLQDVKERKEHQFVIDDICQQLSAIAKLSIATTEVLKLPLLNHLRTQISATLFGKVSVDDLIKKLHPTSALGIYPRNSFFKTFAQFPYQNQRASFGAPWGIETGNTAFLLVAIRKWDWSQQDIKIFAGCGVVQDSVFEKEFAEILKKINSVKKMLFKDEL